jgi:hypothetical protein
MGKKGQKQQSDEKQVERNTRAAIRAEKKGKRDDASFDLQLQVRAVSLCDRPHFPVP